MKSFSALVLVLSALSALAACEGLSSASREPGLQEPRPATEPDHALRPWEGVREIMHAKAEAFRPLFESIVVKDFDEVARISEELTALSLESDWKVHTTLSYSVFSDRFRVITETMAKNARAQDLTAVFDDYEQLTASCRECHAYLRREGLFRYLPPQAASSSGPEVASVLD